MSVGRVHIKVIMQKPRKPCVGCSKRTTVVHPILGVHCCYACQLNSGSQYQIVREFNLFDTVRKVDLITLRHIGPKDVPRTLLCRTFPDGDLFTVMDRFDRARADGFEPNNFYLARHVDELVATHG
jgi:hypothetical protein